MYGLKCVTKCVTVKIILNIPKVFSKNRRKCGTISVSKERRRHMKSLNDTMKGFGDTQQDLAKVLGITNSTMSWKMRGRSEFTQSEIKAIIERYDLTGDEVKYMFFGD